jgi:hypothetical protein
MAVMVAALAPVFPQQPTPEARISFRIIVAESADAARRVIDRLAAGARNVEVEIWWPTSNTRQRFSQVGKNQFGEITEFAGDLSDPAAAAAAAASVGQ